MPRQILGELQHAIMAVLWDRGEATTADVHEALRDDRGLALTTIATMLRKMEDKGVVLHRVDGRQFVYRAAVSEDQVRRSMVGELVGPALRRRPEGARRAPRLRERDRRRRARRAAPAPRHEAGPAMSDFAARALLTYLLHSTLLLGLAALVRRALAERRLAVQEAVLRAALVGAFATTALQLGLDLQPLGGALRLQASARPDGPGTPAVLAAPVADSRWEARLVLAPTPAERALALASGVSWRKALASAWAALAAFGLLRLGIAALRLRRLLRDREPLRDTRLAPQAVRLAGALGLPASVRLSTAPHLDLPLATGVLRPEVCLPIRAVAELGPDEQVALCAHELAHVARRDPAWVLLARLAEALAPLQPLNAWARRRLCELSECLSDDLAVAASARPAGLARSLVDVAALDHRRSSRASGRGRRRAQRPQPSRPPCGEDHGPLALARTPPSLAPARSPRRRSSPRPCSRRSSRRRHRPPWRSRRPPRPSRRPAPPQRPPGAERRARACCTACAAS